LSSLGWPAGILADSGNGATCCIVLTCQTTKQARPCTQCDCSGCRSVHGAALTLTAEFSTRPESGNSTAQGAKGHNMPDWPTGLPNSSMFPIPLKWSRGIAASPAAMAKQPSRASPRTTATGTANRSQAGWTFPDGWRPAGSVQAEGPARQQRRMIFLLEHAPLTRPRTAARLPSCKAGRQTCGGVYA